VVGWRSLVLPVSASKKPISSEDRLAA